MIAKVEPLTTARALRGPFDYRLPREMEGVEVGSVLLVPFGRQRVLGVVVELAESSELPPERLAEPLEALEAGVPPELVRLGLWVGREYCSTPSRGLRLVLPPGISNLSARRLSGELARPPAAAQPVGADAGPVELNAEQAAAVEAIVASLDGEGGGGHLLHGVTGSGKTEVYLAAAAAALERGRGVIVLVPEIALTPQTVARFKRRFGDAVALTHSRMSTGARYDEWRRLRTGEARICVGPRSAIFAPVRELGLIVIDEEHDPSYKQESDPRYDARAVARRRAADAGAVLVAGTATPRPESWGELPHLQLPARVDGRDLPAVEVVDMRGHDGSGPLHGRTLDALHEVARREAKAIVMLNRRGWSPHLSCRSCGRAWECPDCDVSLVLHRGVGRLACHHCGRVESMPEACPDCGSVTLARVGTGTERLEQTLAEAVAPLPVFRLDSDTTGHAGGHHEILSSFERAPAGVLVGTQMVAKGHDFPDVVLGVLLDADATLRFPNFRAEERTFALVAQLAGRSGRGPAGGRVLVQTLAPGAECIRFAAQHDATGFLELELARREALRYPPFASLVLVRLGAPEPEPLELAAERLRAALEAASPPGTDVLGPAPLMRVRGQHRRQLLLKATDRAATVAVVREAVEAAAAAGGLKGIATSVDVDPQ